MENDVQQQLNTLREDYSNHTHRGYDTSKTLPPINAYVGSVLGDGTSLFLPQGWSSAHGGGTGLYTITHNLGTTSFVVCAEVLADSETNQVVSFVTAKTTTTFNIQFQELSQIDANFDFIVIPH